MRILYFRADYRAVKYGGSVSHSEGIIKALRKKYEVCVVSSLEALKPDVFIKPSCSFFVNVFRSLNVIWIALKFKPDIIYQRYTWFGFATLFTFGKLILEWNGSDYWMAKVWNKAWYYPIIRPFEYLMLKRASLVVCVSQALANGVKHQRVIVVPNGVDTERFRPMGVFKRTNFTVGWIGTFGPWHGIQLLAKATRLAENIEWVFVGDGIERDLFLSTCGRTAYQCILPHDAIPYFLASCDALVNASQNNSDGSEFFGSPTKVFEYMAMGKPVFSTPYGQLKDIVPEAGLFTTAEELVAKLQNIPKGLAEECLRRSRLYTWEKNVERIFGAL